MKALKVGDYMDLHPAMLRPNMPVAQAVELLLKSEEIGAPVVDEYQRLVGFVSEQDLLAKMVDSTYYKEAVATVGECMREEVLSVTLNCSVLDLAQQMLEQKPKLYPVVDDDRVVGLITRTRVLKAIDDNLNEEYAPDTVFQGSVE